MDYLQMEREASQLAWDTFFPFLIFLAMLYCVAVLPITDWMRWQWTCLKDVLRNQIKPGREVGEYFDDGEEELSMPTPRRKKLSSDPDRYDDHGRPTPN